MMKAILIISAIILLLFAISFFMKDKLENSEKKSMFECGFDPSHENRNAFSLRFFILTIIFLLFDLEITFIMPLPLEMKNSPASTLFVIHAMVVFLFVTSSFMEWKQGALNWFWFDI